MNIQYHNRLNSTNQLLARRDALINNRADYRTGNRLHQIQTVQIISWEEWDNLGRVLGAGHPEISNLFRVPLNYIYNLLEDYDLGLGNYNGDLLLSMIIEYRNNMYNAIFFIHTNPHLHFIDGEMFRLQFSESDNIKRFLDNTFTDQFTLIRDISEYQLLRLVRDEQSAIYLLNTFLETFNSLQIIPHRVQNFRFDDDIEIIRNDIEIINHIIPDYSEIIQNRVVPHYSWLDEEYEELDTDCSICLYPHDRYIRTPCGHIFGKNCLQYWIETGKKNCPYCRSDFI